MENTSKSVGLNIMRKMEARKMTQLELAKITGLTPTTINHIVNGITQPRLGNLELIARALNCTVLELQGGGLSIYDAAEILSLFANQSPLMQKVILALLHKDSSLLNDVSPELAQCVQLLSKDRNLSKII
jgi:transcriptional regulator with XRE-family HTH domain